MNYGDLQNLTLWRLRQRGVNFGNIPQNNATDYDPPYVVGLLLNEGYADFLSRTKDYPIVALKVGFPSVANATAYALNPIPPNGVTLNPAAMQVYECTYTPTGGVITNPGIEYPVRLISTARFRFLSGQYSRRLSDFGPRALVAAQLYGRPQLDVLPGTATASDLIQVTVCPDIGMAPIGLTCVNGGPMQSTFDVPLIPTPYHMALVEYAVWNAAPAADKSYAEQSSQKKYEAWITHAMEFGSSRTEGDPEQRVMDIWEGTEDPDFIAGVF